MLELDREELCEEDAISSAFSNFFRGLMSTTTPSHDIIVDWELYYPLESRTSLTALEDRLLKKKFARLIFLLGETKNLVKMVLT